jgi:hypothetical protein
MPLTDAEIEQRRQAGSKSRVHGAYSFRDNGETTLEPEKRSRMVEIADLTRERPGLVELMQERVIKSVMICEILEAHIQEEAARGKALTEIPALRQLPAFWNSAQRALSSLYSVTPDNTERLGLAATIIQAVEKGKANG